MSDNEYEGMTPDEIAAYEELAEQNEGEFAEYMERHNDTSGGPDVDWNDPIDLKQWYELLDKMSLDVPDIDE